MNLTISSGTIPYLVSARIISNIMVFLGNRSVGFSFLNISILHFNTLHYALLY